MGEIQFNMILKGMRIKEAKKAFYSVAIFKIVIRFIHALTLHSISEALLQYCFQKITNAIAILNVTLLQIVPPNA